MGSQPGLRHLRHLFDESLRPFSGIASNFLTEEIEKDFLIALSQVLRQIKQWTCDSDSDFDEKESTAEPDDDSECSVSSNSHLDDCHCLTKFILDLIILLDVDSRYAQHLVGNILVAISEFLLETDSGWDNFMQLLCLCLELAISNSLISSEPGALKTSGLEIEPSTTRSLLEKKLRSASWPMVAAIFRVLRNILKYIKQDYDHKLVETYLVSISSLLLNLPWDILRETYFDPNIDTLLGSSKDTILEEITMLFGNSIQFLCSLVSLYSSLDDGVGVPTVICKIIELLPKLTTWCNTKLDSSRHVRISHYFRHKVLMLMVKLSSNTHMKQTIHVKWVDLIRKHFQDLLSQSITMAESDQADFLEGSPFYTSIVYQNSQNLPSRHLQRLTVFLFLKCSLSFVGMKRHPNEAEQGYECLKQDCHPITNADSECWSENLGLVKLFEWLQTQVPADILLDDELYFDRCVRFTFSFLQLFMHEDDILFEMLLQLFRLPFRVILKDEPLADVKNHPVSLASDLFNPIHIFHLFLAQIHYDHQVFLDYLISKDSGSSCAEYLLRALKVVCNSWSLFVEFPGLKEDFGLLGRETRKVLVDYKDRKEHNRGHTQPFGAARDCLFSLKKSINGLNQKKLFPYNPQALLRRLVRFEELCYKQ